MRKKENSVAGSIFWKTMGRLFLTEVIYTAAVALLYVLSYTLLSVHTIWQGDELIYTIAHGLIRFFGSSVQVAIIFWLLGAIIILFIHFYVMARYVQSIGTAAGTLIVDDDKPIALPAPLHQVELHMNRLKSESLANARAAKDAEQRKNDLIVYLAHDLKTPLTSVIGYLSLLNEEKEISQEIQSKYIGIALSKSQRLEDLINEFFDITRFSLTHLTLEPETVSLTRMLEQITFEFNPVMAEKDLSWNLSIPPNMEIICDPDKLERVFDNLIRNAVNYSYPGTSISLCAEADVENITLYFLNSGRTIPEEKLCRLFEQFYRMDSSRGSGTGGAGLGLAIAKEIVLLHGGSIKAESSDEKVVFTVVLPKDCQKNVRN